MVQYYGVVSAVSTPVDRFVDRRTALIQATANNIAVLLESPDVDQRNRVTSSILASAVDLGLLLSGPFVDQRNRVTSDLVSQAFDLTVDIGSPASDSRSRATGDLIASAIDIGATIAGPLIDVRGRITADLLAAAANIGVLLGSPDFDSRNRVTCGISATSSNLGASLESPEIDSRNRVTADISAAAANIGVVLASPGTDQRARVTSDISAASTNLGVILGSPADDQRARTTSLISAVGANLGVSLESTVPEDNTVFDGTYFLQHDLDGYFTEDWNGVIMFWFRSNHEQGSPQTIWSAAKGGADRVKIYLFNDGLAQNYIGIETDDGSGSGTNDYQFPVPTIFDNQPHFIAVRATATRYDIFVDGNKNRLADDESSSGTNDGLWLNLQTGSTGENVDRINIGGFQQPSVDLFTGTLDELVHVRSALSDDEIFALYNAGSGYLIPEIESSADWYGVVGAAYELKSAISQSTWPDYLGTYNMTSIQGNAAEPEPGGLVVGGYTPFNNFWDKFPQIISRYDMYVPDNMKTTASVRFTATNATLWKGTATTPANDLPDTTGNASFSVACWYLAETGKPQQCLFCLAKDGVTATTDGGYHGLVFVNGSITAQSSPNANTAEVSATKTGQPYDQWNFAGGTWEDTNNRRVFGNDGPPESNSDSVAWFQTNNIRCGARPDLWVGARHFCRGQVDNPYVWKPPITDDQMLWVRANRPDYSMLESSTHPDNPGTANLIGAHPFQELSGVRGDLSLSENHLTPDVGVEAGDGYIEESAQTEDRAIVTIDPGATVNQIQRLQHDNAPGAIPAIPFSFAFWFRWTTVPTSNKYLFGIGPSGLNPYVEVFWSNANAALRFNYHDGALSQFIQKSGLVNDTNWHLLVCTVDSVSSMSLYLDDDGGSNKAVTTSSATWPANTLVRIPGRTVGETGANYGSVDIDEVMIFDSQLSAAEVATLYNSGTGELARDIMSGSVEVGSPAKLPIHAWPMDQNSGDYGTDIGTDATPLNLTVPRKAPDDGKGILAGQAVQGTVSIMKDSQQSDDAVQGLVASQPVKALRGTSLGVASFDGTDDVLQSLLTPGLSQPMSFIAVVQFGTDVGTSTRISANPGYGIDASGFNVLTAQSDLRLRASPVTSAGIGVEVWVGLVNVSGQLSTAKGGVFAQQTGDIGFSGLTQPYEIGGYLGSSFVSAELYHLSYYSGLLSTADANEIANKLVADTGAAWSDIT